MPILRFLLAAASATLASYATGYLLWMGPAAILFMPFFALTIWGMATLVVAALASVGFGLFLLLAARRWPRLRPVWVWLGVGAVGGMLITSAFAAPVALGGIGMAAGLMGALAFRLAIAPLLVPAAARVAGTT